MKMTMHKRDQMGQAIKRHLRHIKGEKWKMVGQLWHYKWGIKKEKNSGGKHGMVRCRRKQE